MIVSLSGELDLTSAPRLWRKVHGVLDGADRSSVVVLDLSAASFLDSLGITTLVNLRQRARRQSVELRVVTEPGQLIRRVLGLSGIDTLLAIYDSLDEALANPPAVGQDVVVAPPISSPDV